MKPEATGRVLVAAVLALGVLPALPGTSIAQSASALRAERASAHEAFVASGRRSPSVVVDGTPHPLTALEAAPVTRAGRAGGDGVAGPPHDRDAHSLTTITDEPGMGVPLGGDDVEIARSADFSGSAYLQITSDGRYFVAVAALGDVYVYQSSDKGESWGLWSTFSDPAEYVYYLTELVIAEGTVDRIMFAYSALNTGVVKLAHADINLGAPSWTIVTALSNAGITHGTDNRVDIATDASSYSDFYVYLVAESEDDNGKDIWFARSVDQGDNFEAGYRIADSSVGSDEYYLNPSISFGRADYLHVSYTSYDTTPTQNNNVRYRRASNYASAGIASWGAQQTVRAQGVSDYAASIRISSSLTDDGVYVTLLGLGGAFDMMRFSTDAGTTWNPANEVTANYPGGSGMAPAFVPGGGLVMGGLEILSTSGLTADVVLSHSSTADPTAWTVPQSFSHNDWTGGPTYGRIESMVPDPDFGNRIATVFVQTATPEKIVRFDAEWRRDPGYPNTEVGFPISIPGGHGQTPPAVAEVDGDPEKEIVFATSTGDVYVLNHDGSNVPGWPVSIGSVPYDAGVAVGDLVGNGVPAIVTGTTDGHVYAFDPSGNVLPGWPVDLGTTANVFVAIGALGPPSTRYVVASSYKTVAILNSNGVNVAPSWNPAEIPFGVFAFPPAIGDIDNDGVTDIVSVAGPNVYVHQLNNPLYTGRQFSGESFCDSPTLADIDGDGDLEIAAPSGTGKMFLLDSSLADLPSWPVAVTPGLLTSAALSNILGTGDIEIVFARNAGPVHVFYANGVEQTGYPQSPMGAPNFMPPMLYPVNVSTVSNVNIGTPTGFANSWRNIPTAGVPGWPRNLPGGVEETFAAGDIDNDGRGEIVVLGLDFVVVFDVGTAPTTDPRRTWPMYGHDAQRTGCLDCDEILTAVGDTPAAEVRTALDAHPNPFNPTTTIEYDVAVAGKVSLEIFDVAGRRVAVLLDNERRPAGHYALTYNATGASGVYFARLRTAGGEVTRKIVLLK